MSVLPACVFVYYMCAWCHQRFGPTHFSVCPAIGLGRGVIDLYTPVKMGHGPWDITDPHSPFLPPETDLGMGGAQSGMMKHEGTLALSFCEITLLGVGEFWKQLSILLFMGLESETAAFFLSLRATCPGDNQKMDLPGMMSCASGPCPLRGHQTTAGLSIKSSGCKDTDGRLRSTGIRMVALL